MFYHADKWNKEHNSKEQLDWAKNVVEEWIDQDGISEYLRLKRKQVGETMLMLPMLVRSDDFVFEEKVKGDGDEEMKEGKKVQEEGEDLRKQADEDLKAVLRTFGLLRIYDTLKSNDWGVQRIAEAPSLLDQLWELDTEEKVNLVLACINFAKRDKVSGCLEEDVGENESKNTLKSIFEKLGLTTYYQPSVDYGFTMKKGENGSHAELINAGLLTNERYDILTAIKNANTKKRKKDIVIEEFPRDLQVAGTFDANSELVERKLILKAGDNFERWTIKTRCEKLGLSEDVCDKICKKWKRTKHMKNLNLERLMFLSIPVQEKEKIIEEFRVVEDEDHDPSGVAKLDLDIKIRLSNEFKKPASKTGNPTVVHDPTQTPAPNNNNFGSHRSQAIRNNNFGSYPGVPNNNTVGYPSSNYNASTPSSTPSDPFYTHHDDSDSDSDLDSDSDSDYSDSEESTSELGKINSILKGIGMDQYYRGITEKFKTMKQMKKLTHADLRACGVAYFGQKDKIITTFKDAPENEDGSGSASSDSDSNSDSDYDSGSDYDSDCDSDADSVHRYIMKTLTSLSISGVDVEQMRQSFPTRNILRTITHSDLRRFGVQLFGQRDAIISAFKKGEDPKKKTRSLFVCEKKYVNCLTSSGLSKIDKTWGIKKENDQAPTRIIVLTGVANIRKHLIDFDQYGNILPGSQIFPHAVEFVGGVSGFHKRTVQLDRLPQTQGKISLQSLPYLKALPQNLNIRGSLQVKNLPQITVFPAQSIIQQNLLLDNLPCLQVLEDGISVGGNLQLSNLPSLIKICPGLTVNNCLEINKCLKLQSVPKEVYVGSKISVNDCKSLRNVYVENVNGDLKLKNCLSLESLGAISLIVDGKLSLKNCPRVKKLSEHQLTVNGDLILKDLSFLTHLPDEVIISNAGNLTISNCLHLKHLPSTLIVDGNINLKWLPSLCEIPDEVSLGGKLTLSHCSGLNTIRFVTSRSPSIVQFENCDKLQQIVGLIEVEELSIINCESFRSLPENLVVTKLLDFKDCHRFETFPESFRCAGSIVLKRLFSLSHIPTSVILCNSVIVEGCDSLVSFTPTFEKNVLGRMTIRNCGSLRSISPTQPLTVEGNLILDTLPLLEQLPIEILVKKNFEILNVGRLNELPSKIHVENNLKLEQVSSLVCLPPIHLGNSLIIKKCAKLESLREGSLIHGSLKIQSCHRLLELGDSLKVLGNVTIDDCAQFKAFGFNVCIMKNLTVSKCSNLVSISNDTTMLGSFSIDECEKFSGLPCEFVIKDLKVSNCARFKDIGDNLLVDESISLSKLPKLITLPETYLCGGKLIIQECNSFRAIEQGKQSRIGKELVITNCPNLRYIAGEFDCGVNLTNLDGFDQGVRANTKVFGKLKMLNCSINQIEENVHCNTLEVEECADLLSVGNDITVSALSIKNCKNLINLPQVLDVQGECTLTGNESLEHLPKVVRVGKTLDLSDCINIKELPSNIQVGQHLNLEGCMSITSLPVEILAWPPPIHEIRLSRSGLDDAAMEWLRNADAPNVQFHVSLTNTKVEQFQTLEQAVKFWTRAAGKPELASTMSFNISAMYLAGILAFLSQLRGSKEFVLKEIRPKLANRIVEVLLTLCKDDSISEEVMVMMADSTDTCDDKPIWALNQMMTICKIAQARHDEEKLKQVGRGVMRLGIVHNHVKSKIQRLGFVDDVCVYLRFEIALCEELNLPVSAEAMHFPSYIKVTEEEIEAARKDALDVTEKEFELWLENWHEWQSVKRKKVSKSLKWEELPTGNWSRIKDLKNLFGSDVVDPVNVHGIQCSLQDLMQHWINTGMDLHNVPLTTEEILELTKPSEDEQQIK